MDEKLRKKVRVVVHDIKELKIQGARNITIACLQLLRDYASIHSFDEGFSKLADELAALRPTQSVLYNAMKLAKKAEKLEDVEKLISYLKNVAQNIGKEWHHIIKNGEVIATHCHSSELVALLKEARKQGKEFTVIVTETRPKMQGIITARELSEAGIKVIYVVDTALSHFKDEITKFMFGCDAVRREGIYNKVGTCMMAVFAKEIRKPCYFVGDVLKVDKRIEKLEIEMRSPAEIINPKELGKNVEILNPAFDCTPWKYVTAYLSAFGKARRWGEARKLLTSLKL